MPSQFFGLNIAYKGLLASNAALNTTANNIANVQTEGYSRQQVKQQASDALRVFQTYGCAGAGVETLAIERVRDDFYDAKYWRNNTQVGEYNMKQYYMQQVEAYFYDSGDNAGFKTVFDQLMITGLQALMDDPSSNATKTQFVGFADSLADYFNGLAGNMENLQKDVNQEIKLKVDEVNSIAGQIATLNKQINTIELTGPMANELRDQRTVLVDRLSEIVSVSITETPVYDTNNPDRETGANRFIVKIAGGQILVDDSEFNGLECVARTEYEKVNQTDIDGLYEVYWENGQRFGLNNASLGGELQGLVEMRDGNNGENFRGIVTDVGKTEDGSRDTVTVEVSDRYLQDLNKCNLSDQGGIINLGNVEVYYDSWEYTCSYDDDGNATYSYTFTLSDSEKNGTYRVTNDRVGKLADIGSSIDYQGVPYYMSQMNEWLRTFSQKFNDILKRGNDGTGVGMFSGNLPTEEAQYNFPDDFRYDVFSFDGTAKSITVKAEDDSYYRMTAHNVAVTMGMIEDPSIMPNKFKDSDGVEQNDLLEALKKMVSDKDEMSFRGGNASEFLQNILSDVALNSQGANTMYENFTGIQGAIDNQRLSISGVDEDEEAVSLVKYQNAYNLASKMIQTLTEIYDRLILETGV